MRPRCAHCAAESVQVRLGRGESLDERVTYRTAKAAKYELKGTLTFTAPVDQNAEGETNTVFVDGIAQYVWLQIAAPVRNRNVNKSNQVSVLNTNPRVRRSESAASPSAATT